MKCQNVKCDAAAERVVPVHLEGVMASLLKRGRGQVAQLCVACTQVINAGAQIHWDPTNNEENTVKEYTCNASLPEGLTDEAVENGMFLHGMEKAMAQPCACDPEDVKLGWHEGFCSSVLKTYMSKLSDERYESNKMPYGGYIFVRVCGDEECAIKVHEGLAEASREVCCGQMCYHTETWECEHVNDKEKEMNKVTPTASGVLCGNCRKNGVDIPYHETVEQVKACYGHKSSSTPAQKVEKVEKSPDTDIAYQKAVEWAKKNGGKVIRHTDGSVSVKR